jgi:hypothetical protein
MSNQAPMLSEVPDEESTTIMQLFRSRQNESTTAPPIRRMHPLKCNQLGFQALFSLSCSGFCCEEIIYPQQRFIKAKLALAIIYF